MTRTYQVCWSSRANAAYIRQGTRSGPEVRDSFSSHPDSDPDGKLALNAAIERCNQLDGESK